MTNRERIMKLNDRELAREISWMKGYEGCKEEVDFWHKWLQKEVKEENAEEAQWVPSTKYKGFLVCSACEDCYIEGWSDKERKWRYCPQCGKRMKQGGEYERRRGECNP